MACDVKIIADSWNAEFGTRLTTFQLKYWRAIHSEVMTHRVFSRNASSSRAIPIAKMIDQVRHDPAGPIHWGKNIPGMQAREEVEDIESARWAWVVAATEAADRAEKMAGLGLHKQVVNRILEPFQYIHVVLTGTEFYNFFDLRAHHAAQPEIQELARKMKEQYDINEPVRVYHGDWHLPYIHQEEKGVDVDTLRKMSAARCARVSYMKHDGTNPSVEDDLELFNQLVTRPYTDKRGTVYGEGEPIHASPCEHQAMFIGCSKNRSNPFSGNFDQNWMQYRQLL